MKALNRIICLAGMSAAVITFLPFLGIPFPRSFIAVICYFAVAAFAIGHESKIEAQLSKFQVNNIGKTR